MFCDFICMEQLLHWDFCPFKDALRSVVNSFFANFNCAKWNGKLHQIKQWWSTQGFLNENCGLIILLPWRKFHYKPFFPNIIIYFLPWEFFETKRKKVQLRFCHPTVALPQKQAFSQTFFRVMIMKSSKWNVKLAEQ